MKLNKFKGLGILLVSLFVLPVVFAATTLVAPVSGGNY